VVAEQHRERTRLQPTRGVPDLFGSDMHGGPFDLEYLRRADPRPLVAERRAHVRHVHSAAPKLVVDARMRVHPGPALMNDERDSLRRIAKRMACGAKVADARTGLPHDRDLAAKRPMLQASLHPVGVHEEPHLVIGRRGTQAFPQHLYTVARVHLGRIDDYAHRHALRLGSPSQIGRTHRSVRAATVRTRHDAGVPPQHARWGPGKYDRRSVGVRELCSRCRLSGLSMPQAYPWQFAARSREATTWPCFSTARRCPLATRMRH
jgi:hypothetical protein